MKKLWSQVKQNSWILGIATAVSLTMGIVGATYAYYQHSSELDNFLKASLVAGEIVENEDLVGESNQFELKPGQTIPKRVKFKNTGEAAVFVRVSFGETWIGNTGEWLVNDDTYATLHWTNAWHEEWQQKEDGWYYYKKILPHNETTAEVLSTVEFASLEELLPAYHNGSYQLTFAMEVVQFSDEASVNSGALASAFNRTATVADGVVTWN